jgi:putative YphP/YqiW family bacilliredoxin
MTDHYKPIPLTGAPKPANRAMYPDEMTKPMREELTRAGVQELTTAEDVQRQLAEAKGVSAVLINSVCGCAAGGARPGLLAAMRASGPKPDRYLSAFAGVHPDAVAAVRSLIPAPPSSPCIAVFRDGKPIMMMHRSDIEIRDAGSIAGVLNKMFEEAAKAGAAA